MSDLPEETIDGIREFEIKETHPLPVEMFNKRSNKSTRLIENDNADNFVKGKHRDYTFSLIEPVFVREIVVYTEDYASYNNASFSWRTVRGKNEENATVKNSNNVFLVVINDVIDSFSFKPDKRYMGNPMVEKISVRGLTLSEMEEALEDLGDVDRFKSKLIKHCETKLSQVKTQRRRWSY